MLLLPISGLPANHCRSYKKIITSFPYGSKNYFENKSKFIRELGYINDSSCVAATEKLLSQMYRQDSGYGDFSK